MRVNALGVPQSSPHSKNESVRLWRLLEGPVSASLPNSLELIRARCSGSAALSSKTRSRCEAGQTLTPDGSIQKDSGLPQKCRTQACTTTCAVDRSHLAALATKGFFGKCRKTERDP